MPRAITQAFQKKAKDVQQGLTSLNNTEQNDGKQKLSQEVLNQLVGLYNQGQFSAVVEQAQVLTKQYPEVFIIWNVLGAAAAQIGKLDEAIKAYKKALTIKSDSPEIYSNMGVAFQAQSKFDVSIKAYNKAVSLKPDYAEAYNNMGVSLKAQGKQLLLAGTAYDVCNGVELSHIHI